MVSASAIYRKIIIPFTIVFVSILAAVWVLSDA